MKPRQDRLQMDFKLEGTMECSNCKNTITPGMEIVVDKLSRERVHCPYCLQLLLEDTMECNSCKNTITSGMEIVVNEQSGEQVHCPHCFQLLKPETMSQEIENNGSDKRSEMRRKVRTQFIDRLVEQSHNRQVQCPVCEHGLNKIDLHLLKDGEHFRCHLCSYDLAAFAYREEAYHEQRWYPVVHALLDLMVEKECNDCGHLAAIAKACQKAFSWMPKSEFKFYNQLNRILRHSEWKEPACDWESCVAVRQYRKTAGEGLLLL